MKIVDEFTGRILEGRRWSEGLHQAIEAKEGVRDPGGEPDARDDHAPELLPHVRQARRDDRHGADRGERVHRRSTSSPVVQIPTNRADGPRATATIRSSRPRTASGRPSSRTSRSATKHGQPVLVGTISVEISELLSAAADAAGDPAHRPQRQAEHAARGARSSRTRARRARSRSRPTWPAAASTSSSGQPRAPAELELAKLGLTPEMPDYDEHRAARARGDRAPGRGGRKDVVEAGGLYVLGTERHESRRIDNQLRGRSGRQGDPGETRFYLSGRGRPRAPVRRRPDLQDPRPPRDPDDEGTRSRSRRRCSPSRSRSAQKKVEEQNFLARKHVAQVRRRPQPAARGDLHLPRRGARGSRHVRAGAREIVTLIERTVDEYTEGDFVDDWDVPGLLSRMQEIFNPSDAVLATNSRTVDREDLTAAPPGGGDGAIRPARAGARARS